jgi:hypothetical protein
MGARLRRDDLAKQRVAPIVAAADGLPINVLVAWAQDAPPFIIPEARLVPSDAPPRPQRFIARQRRHRGRARAT